MRVLEVRRGVLLEPVGDRWAAFNAVSGETHLLNNEAAAVIEVLSEAPRSVRQVTEVIALDSDQPFQAVWPLLEDASNLLEAVGLIRSVLPLERGIQPADTRLA